jgi:hypothetical protein
MTIDVGTTLLALLSVSVFLPMHWMRIALLQPPDRNSGRDSHLPDFRKPAGECGFGPFHVCRPIGAIAWLAGSGRRDGYQFVFGSQLLFQFITLA